MVAETFNVYSCSKNAQMKGFVLAALGNVAGGASLESLASLASFAALANCAGTDRMMRFVLIQYAEYIESVCHHRCRMACQWCFRHSE